MPKVYDVLGLPDGKTDYFMEPHHASSPRVVDLKDENLARVILEDLKK
jgi:hypothetical protein